MSFDDLRVFLTVADRLSFAEASRRLELPTSTVSRQVARLEDALGARLLQRTSRRVGLTAEGARLVERASPLVTTLGAVLEGAGREDEPAGRLRITAPLSTGSGRVAALIFAFAERYPRVEVDLVLTNTVVDLVAEGVDLALRAGPVIDQELVARKLWSVPYGLAAAPRLVREILHDRKVIAPDEIGHLPAVLTRPDGWRLLRPGGAIERVRPRARFRTADPRVAVAAAVSGLGVVCAPLELIEAQGRRLLPLTVKARKVAPRDLFAVYPSRHLVSTRVRMMLDWIVAGMKQSHPAGVRTGSPRRTLGKAARAQRQGP